MTHIEDGAIVAHTDIYAKNFPPSSYTGMALLDICYSLISHDGPKGYTADRIADKLVGYSLFCLAR